jgi:LAS superfamily LD-carboxypeptidase LdcB
VPLTILATGSQLLDWPASWDEYNAFKARWGLTDPVAIRALALGWWSERALGIRLWIVSGRRTGAEQASLRARYVAGDSTYPAAKAGTSLHEAGRAFDVGTDYALDDSRWQAVGDLGKRLGLRWGGDFVVPDFPHFEQ